MSGVVQITLTDNELRTLMAWAAVATSVVEASDIGVGLADAALYERIRTLLYGVSCKPCQTAACPVDPNAP